MKTEYLAVMALASLSLLTTWIGVFLALRLRNNSNAIAVGIGYSVGIMLLISLLELAPEAISRAGLGAVAPSFLAGIGIIWSAHLLIPHRHLTDERGHGNPRLVRTVYLVAFGLVLHDFPEGFAMANGYIASPELGIMLALAIALHNIPEEFAMAVPAVMLGRKRLMYAAAALSALAEPLGAAIGLVAVALAPALNSHFMAFAAGAMVFVSVHELIPMARRHRQPGWFAAGAVLSVAVYALLTLIEA